MSYHHNQDRRSQRSSPGLIKGRFVGVRITLPEGIRKHLTKGLPAIFADNDEAPRRQPGVIGGSQASSKNGVELISGWRGPGDTRGRIAA